MDNEYGPVCEKSLSGSSGVSTWVNDSDIAVIVARKGRLAAGTARAVWGLHAGLDDVFRVTSSLRVYS